MQAVAVATSGVEGEFVRYLGVGEGLGKEFTASDEAFVIIGMSDECGWDFW